MPARDRKRVAGIRDARAGRPCPSASPGTANVDRCRRCCLVRPVRMVQQRRQGVLPATAALASAVVPAVVVVAAVLLIVAPAAVDAVSP